mmetsp:Transcript_114111/g.310051  ORF Transcript_114111/g.310051 Transcript_114111/m.310051 type:complete len:326 (-) Transcript_114111:805-1782(-)
MPPRDVRLDVVLGGAYLPEDHTRVDLDALGDEQGAKARHLAEIHCGGNPRIVGDQHAVPLPRLRRSRGPHLLELRHDGGRAARDLPDPRAQPQRRGRGDLQLDGLPVSFGGHVDDLRAALRQAFYHSATLVDTALDVHVLPRLQPHAVLAQPLHHRRRRERHLVALPSHLLDKDTELHLPPAPDLEVVPLIGLLHLDGRIGHRLPLQALPDGEEGHVLAVLAGQGRAVHGAPHRQHRRVDRRALDAGNLGVRDERLRPPGDEARDAHRDDVAGHGLLNRLPGHARDHRDVLHLPAGDHFPVEALGHDLVALLHPAAEDLSGDRRA